MLSEVIVTLTTQRVFVNIHLEALQRERGRERERERERGINVVLPRCSSQRRSQLSPFLWTIKAVVLLAFIFSEFAKKKRSINSQLVIWLNFK